MRKLLMLVVIAVAAFAVVAAPASGQRLNPNPSFPYDDFDPGSWAAVDATNWSTQQECNAQVSNCPFGGQGAYWGVRLTVNGQLWYDTGACHANNFDGAFDVEGDLEVTDGPTGACWQYPPDPAGYPWNGETCLNVATGETWVRLWAQLESNGGANVYDGEMFGRVVASDFYNDQYIDFGGSILNAPTAPNVQFQNWGGTKFPIPEDIAFEGRLDESQEEYVPCSWPELQA